METSRSKISSSCYACWNAQPTTCRRTGGGASLSRIVALIFTVITCLRTTKAWTTATTAAFGSRPLATQGTFAERTKMSRQHVQLWRIFAAATVKGDTASSSSSLSSSNNNNNSTHQTIYSMPALYDLAFGYRDFDEEVDFLLARHAEMTTTAVRSLVEVAAGPARHSLTALRLAQQQQQQSSSSVNGETFVVHCIDSSPAMAGYAQQLLENECAALEAAAPLQAAQLRDNFHYQVADMRNFTIERKVDTAWILLGSLQHLTTNTDVIQCLQSVHRALQPHGTVWIELPHPRETFAMVECTRNGWKVPLDLARDVSDSVYDDDDSDEDEESESSAGGLSIVWGDEGDEFDPITQVRQFTIKMELTGMETSDEMQSIKQVVPLRLFTAQEIDALARCAGFQVVAMFGALEEGVSVQDDEASFRLICGLRKQ